MSNLKVNTLQNINGVEVYTCKAWVNFNASSGSPVIRAAVMLAVLLTTVLVILL